MAPISGWMDVDVFPSEPLPVTDGLPTAQFGPPFILAVKGCDRAEIIAEFERRVDNDHAAEFAECLQQVATITGFRLDALLAGGDCASLNFAITTTNLGRSGF